VQDVAYNTHEEIKNAYTIFVGNPQGKRPTGRSRYRGIDMGFSEIGREVEDCFHVAQDRVQ
jgi:hypothetical protein